MEVQELFTAQICIIHTEGHAHDKENPIFHGRVGRSARRRPGHGADCLLHRRLPAGFGLGRSERASLHAGGCQAGGVCRRSRHHGLGAPRAAQGGAADARSRGRRSSRSRPGSTSSGTSTTSWPPLATDRRAGQAAGGGPGPIQRYPARRAHPASTAGPSRTTRASGWSWRRQGEHGEPRRRIATDHIVLAFLEPGLVAFGDAIGRPDGHRRAADLAQHHQQQRNDGARHRHRPEQQRLGGRPVRHPGGAGEASGADLAASCPR